MSDRQRWWLILVLLASTLVGFAAGWFTRGLTLDHGPEARPGEALSQPAPEPPVATERVQDVAPEAPTPPPQETSRVRRSRPRALVPTPPQAPPQTPPPAPPRAVPEIPVQSLP
jgi:hypothetical protein